MESRWGTSLPPLLRSTAWHSYRDIPLIDTDLAYRYIARELRLTIVIKAGVSIEISRCDIIA